MILAALRSLMRRLRSDPAADRTPPQQRTADDQALARRIHAALEHDLESAADVQGLHFYVQDGAVTIYGTVPHALDHDLLLTFVRQLSGVERVTSHLRLAEPAPDDEAPDEPS